MAERVVIQAAPRTILGKKVAGLRRSGRLPANVYGRGIPSQAVDIDAREFSRTIKNAGLRAMIQLAVDGEASPRYVILRGIERKGGTGDPIHIDFFQVDPEQPITGERAAPPHRRSPGRPRPRRDASHQPRCRRGALQAARYPGLTSRSTLGGSDELRCLAQGGRYRSAGGRRDPHGPRYGRRDRQRTSRPRRYVRRSNVTDYSYPADLAEAGLRLFLGWFGPRIRPQRERRRREFRRRHLDR